MFLLQNIKTKCPEGVRSILYNYEYEDIWGKKFF